MATETTNVHTMLLLTIKTAELVATESKAATDTEILRARMLLTALRQFVPAAYQLRNVDVSA
ncbi:TPA: hypothetical protein SMF68_002004 [Serratia marcescens]|uniref:hypothetical protein n=1 Tax=Serratia TaxID=613 RepID=UPI000F7E3526|nr:MULTISPECIES: hypothetical protein [Serratia]EGS5643883.1 hypothetical protein [Serratia marcescens]EIJ9189436.1 hypothetical protein [Serratia marcescens]MBH2523024.1 hypothetical protein [Serratia marcescens]MBH2621060.1 hypothetical protein [Serratia marcescens]MBH2783283.1 hypothetical protein [Serratia marcescens]